MASSCGMPAAVSDESPSRWKALTLIALGELLAMSLWFSASAVSPALKAEWTLGDAAAAWLTLAVQLGFVVGTLSSAIANLPDVVPARRLLAASAGIRAAGNTRPPPPRPGPRTAPPPGFAGRACPWRASIRRPGRSPRAGSGAAGGPHSAC